MRNDGTIELELSVPKNAKYFVLSGKNMDDSVVVGTFSIKNEETLIEIQPVSVLNGFWHHIKNSLTNYRIEDFLLLLYNCSGRRKRT